MHFTKTSKLHLLIAMLLLAISCSGCVRYSKNISPFYEPVTTASGGSGQLYIVSAADQQGRANNMKWVIGTVKNDDNKKIDEILSPLSATELIKDAIGQELKRSGYAVTAVTSRPADQPKSIVISKVDMSLDQISDIADIKATCNLTISLDIYKKGQLVKKLQYQSKASETTIKDRDLLANRVLQETIQTAMQKAVPDLIAILEP